MRAWSGVVIPVRAASEELLLDCGDGVVLQAFHSSPRETRAAGPGKRLGGVATRLGRQRRLDLRSFRMSQTMFELGFEVVRLNLRDHGATHHLNRDLFHSCRLPEVVGAGARARGPFPEHADRARRLFAGRNFMLRVAADPEARHLPLQHIIAVSPVLDPAVTMTTLERGSSIYHHYFVRKWTRSLAKKQLAWPDHYDFDELLTRPQSFAK